MYTFSRPSLALTPLELEDDNNSESTLNRTILPKYNAHCHTRRASVLHVYKSLNEIKNHVGSIIKVNKGLCSRSYGTLNISEHVRILMLNFNIVPR